jgi:hypothetical protein
VDAQLALRILTPVRGRDRQELEPQVQYQRFRLLDMDMHTSRFEPLPTVLGTLWVVDGSLVSYKGIQGALEELWTTRGGTGIGTEDSSAV